ncbi:hypothetical protein MN608_02284 [Microdochium nivale]|nr:hypothetical protein MN608_02284 [Microdochium nivale]
MCTIGFAASSGGYLSSLAESLCLSNNLVSTSLDYDLLHVTLICGGSFDGPCTHKSYGARGVQYQTTAQCTATPIWRPKIASSSELQRSIPDVLMASRLFWAHPT